MIESPERAQEASPLPCHTDEEWRDYRRGLIYASGRLYSRSGLRRRFNVTDEMISACLDCQIPFQREMMLAGRCRPPAHIRPITPFERALDDTGDEE